MLNDEQLYKLVSELLGMSERTELWNALDEALSEELERNDG